MRLLFTRMDDFKFRPKWLAKIVNAILVGKIHPSKIPVETLTRFTLQIRMDVAQQLPQEGEVQLRQVEHAHVGPVVLAAQLGRGKSLRKNSKRVTVLPSKPKNSTRPTP